MRFKITEFIAKNKSRQEFVPLVGKTIDKAHAEPLHLMNKSWQYFLKLCLQNQLLSLMLKAVNLYSKCWDTATLLKLTATLLKLPLLSNMGLRQSEWPRKSSNGLMKLKSTGQRSRCKIHVRDDNSIFCL